MRSTWRSPAIGRMRSPRQPFLPACYRTSPARHATNSLPQIRFMQMASKGQGSSSVQLSAAVANRRHIGTGSALPVRKTGSGERASVADAIVISAPPISATGCQSTPIIVAAAAVRVAVVVIAVRYVGEDAPAMKVSDVVAITATDIPAAHIAARSRPGARPPSAPTAPSRTAAAYDPAPTDGDTTGMSTATATTTTTVPTLLRRRRFISRR